MSRADSDYPRPRRLERWARIVAIAGGAACILGAVLVPEAFYRGYLLGCMFWLGVALGCLAVLMLHHLVGGVWGFLIRRILEAATRTLPASERMEVPDECGR